MSEENKIEETEEVKEINPVDEYLNNYKEQKLAEFCVQKDKEIQGLKEERQKMVDQIVDLKLKVKKYEETHDRTWKNIRSLYDEIKKLSVDDYLELYYLFSNDIGGRNQSITATVPNFLVDTYRCH